MRRATKLSELSDHLLLARLTDGDEQAMRLLFERHRDFVFRVALGSCGEREEAVDVVQEVFLALLQQAATLELNDTRLSTWLYRVTRNRGIDRRRRAAAATGLNERWVEPIHDTGPEATLLETERRRLLGRAVARLPDRPREVFVLRVGMGLSANEAASLIGIQPGAVRVALSKAKALLQEALTARCKVS
jgi:RNA polymerase sigma-70 factor (ECF subfamily)